MVVCDLQGRLNLLAQHLWNLVPDGEATDDAWREAYDAALTYVRPQLLAVGTGSAETTARRCASSHERGPSSTRS